MVLVLARVAVLAAAVLLVWVAGSQDSPLATLGELALVPGSVTVLGRFARTVTLGDFDLGGAGGTDYFLARLPR